MGIQIINYQIIQRTNQHLRIICPIQQIQLKFKEFRYFDKFRKQKFYIISSMHQHQQNFIQTQHYYELSEIVRLPYQETPSISILPQVEEIKGWTQTQQTKPLLITSEEAGGKKTLILEYLRSQSGNIGVVEFASVESGYSSILYRIMIKLRNILDINQQVELNEEKLRRYFHYWLETVSNQIDRKYIGYSQKQKKKVIIVIEGIDKMVDSKNNPVLPSFWLPNTIPHNIKLILTATHNSDVAKAIKQSVSHHLHHHLPVKKVEELKNQIKLKFKIKSKTDLSLPELKIMSRIIEGNRLFNFEAELGSFQEFLTLFIDYVSNQNLTVDIILRLLGCLVLSKKGLSKDMLRKIVKINSSATSLFFMHFQSIFIKVDQFYLISSATCKNAIKSLIQSKQLGFTLKTLQQGIGKIMKKIEMSIHNLEERIHHLLQAKNYSELKQVLSRIQHFLILYTPLTKQLLCMCWFQLELQFQYDLVFEYNKSMERFLNNYYPTPEDTFKIIFQLSLFFKEYSEFENSKTPKFRHPPIRGEAELLREISLHDELLKMGMYQKYKEKTKNLHDKNQCSEQEEIKEVEKLNVKIKFHQQKFQNFYLELMKPFINEYCFFSKKNKKQNNHHLDDDSDYSDQQCDQNKISFQKIKDKLMLKKFSDYGEEEYHRLGEKKTYYYYKQWIWMQFPWISQSILNNFSQQIYSCIKSPTEFMPIDKQFQLIQSAVKIAKIARNNKKQIYQKKQIELTPITSSHASQEMSKVQDQVQVKRKITLKKQSIKKNPISYISERKQYFLNENKKKESNQNTFITNLSLNQSYIEEETEFNKRLSKIQEKIEKGKQWLQRTRKSQNKSQILVISKINELKNENRKLLTSIENIKKNNQPSSVLKAEPRINNLNSKLEKIYKENERIDKVFKSQEQLKIKLQTIIKLCDINKSHGSESADLSNFLTSLKIMTKIQQDNIESLIRKGKRIVDENRQAIKKLKIQRNKMKKDGQLKTTKDLFKLIHTPRNHNLEKKPKSTRRKKAVEKDEEKKKQALQKSFQHIKNIEMAFKECLDMQFGREEKNEEKLSEIEYIFNKYKELNWKLNQIQTSNQQKRQELVMLESKMKQIESKNEYDKEKEEREKLQDLELKKKNLAKNNEFLKKCIKMLHDE